MYIDIHFENHFDNHFDNHNHNYHILVALDTVLDIVVGIDNMDNFQHIGIVFFFFDVFFLWQFGQRCSYL